MHVSPKPLATHAAQHNNTNTHCTDGPVRHWTCCSPTRTSPATLRLMGASCRGLTRGAFLRRCHAGTMLRVQLTSIKSAWGTTDSHGNHKWLDFCWVLCQEPLFWQLGKELAASSRPWAPGAAKSSAQAGHERAFRNIVHNSQQDRPVQIT